MNRKYAFGRMLGLCTLLFLVLQGAAYAATLPAVFGSDAAVLKGRKTAVNAVFNITLSAVSNQAVSVNYATANNTALAGTDYTAVSGTLTIPANTRSTTVSVPVLPGAASGSDKTFFLNLSAPVNATIGTAQATGNILDTSPALAFSSPQSAGRYQFLYNDYVGGNLYPTIGSNYDMELVDFDNDEKLDLLVPSTGNDTSPVWLFRGNGNGTFREPFALSSTNNASGSKPLAVGDLNNDGLIDYVVANYGTTPANGRIDIMLNGSGGLTGTSVLIGNYPMAVTLADLNKDGFLDIAVACDYGSGASGTTKVRVLLNNGDGTVGTPLELDTASNGIMGITAGDFNKDGNVDLAVTLENANKIAVFYNLGDISTASASQTTVGTYPSGIASGDLNGDSYPDFVTANYNSRNISVVIKRPNATGAVFNAVNYDVGIQPYRIKLVDFDGDGFPDIYASNSDGAVILQNLQDGTFSLPMFIAGNSVGVATGDIDGDGDIDLIQSNDGAGRVRIQLNRKIDAALFAPIEEKIHVVESQSIASFLVNADFSGSGYDDIIAAMPSYGGSALALYHYKNNQNGTLANPQLMYSGAIPAGRQAAVADFNGDGKRDLAIASSNGSAGVYLFYNNGSGSLALAGTVNTLTGVNSIIALDVDGDGDQDLVISHTLGSVSILRNDGSGGFTLTAPADSQLPTGSLSAGHLTSGNFSSDTTNDLAVAIAEGIAILPGTGATFGSSTSVPLSGMPKILVSGDFNGDGTSDLAALIPAAGKLAILLNNGAGGFATPVYYTSDANPTSMSSADVDHDGDTDLLVISDSGDTQVFNNDGSGVLTLLSRISPHSSSFDRTCTFANLDGNSYPDFVTGELFSQISTAYRFGLSSYRNIMQPDVPKLAALSINPGSTTVSTAVTGTVTLSSNAPSGGARVELSNNNGCATVPASVLVPQGAATVDFTITPTSNCEDSSVLVGASYMGSYRAARLYVLPIIPSSVAITASSVLGGESLSVTVTLNAPAKEGGIFIALSSNSTKLLLPYTSTTITDGKSSITFTVTTKAVSEATIASITAATAKGSASASVTLNPVAGSVAFDAPVTISQAYGYSLVTDDFNKDNKPDLAYAWYGLAVAPGNGNGTFATATTYPATYTKKVAKGDFNKDGYPDLAVLNPGSPSFVTIFLNDTNGGFLPKVDYTTDGNNSSDIATGDFNGDGAPDIAVANPSGPTSRLSILLNNGSGGFSNGVSINESFNMPQALVTGDFNGDDITDIATVRDLKITILSGNSDANGKGDGTFQIGSEIALTSTSGYPLCNQIAAADLNNDGLLDLVLPCHLDSGVDSKEIRTFRNNGFGFITTGSIDLLMGSYSTWHNIPVTIADFNGDGAADIAVAYSQYLTPGNVSIALNNGAGLFSTAFSFPADIHPAGIVSADFDKDGDMDLAVIHENSGKLSIYTNTLLTPTADIAVSLTDTPDPVSTSGTITYTATVTNNSDNTSKSVVLSNTQPVGTTYVSATSSKGNCSHTSGTVTCTIGDISSIDTVTVTIRISAPASPSTVTNTVNLTSQTGDPVLANNSASTSTQVSHPAQILTIYTSGSGAGTITPDTGSISWSDSTGTATYAYNTTVTLTAAAAEGSIFVGWGDGCSGTGTCQVTLNAPVQITAWFEPLPVNAVCGVNPITPVPAEPVNLCEQGFATAVSGSGPWSWGCQGLWGGSDVTCTASYGLISSHPNNSWIQSGQTATLTVSATGTEPLSYQWYRGASGDISAPIEGAILTSYTTPVLSAGTSYWVRVSNPEGSTDSTTTRVTGKGLGFFAYVPVATTGEVKVIDESGAVMANIPVGGSPVGVGTSANGSHAYVTSIGTNTVSRIDTLTNSIVNTFTLGLADGLYGIAVGPQFSFVSDSYATTKIHSINNLTQAVSTLTQSPAGYGRGVAFSPDYSKVFAARGSYITFLNGSTGNFLGTYSVPGCTAEGVITSPDGSKLYVSCSNSGTVHIMSTTTGALSFPITTGGANLAGMALDPDLNRLYVANKIGSVIVINTADNTVSATIPVSGAPYGLSLSPDRSQLFVAQSSGYSMAIIDTATMNITTTFPLGGYLESVGAFTVGDATPDTFSFPEKTDVALNSDIDSDPIDISGVDGPVRIFISGGTYSINGGTFTAAVGKVKNGDSVVVRITSSDLINTAASAQLNIGTASTIFTATTASPVVGVCGSSNGGSFNSAPSSNLCAAGVPGPVSGTGPWSWNCSGQYGGADSETCSATVSQYQLSVAFGGDGGILVQSTPPGILCYAAAPTENCSYSYSFGTPVELTATQNGISELTGWTNADVPSGNPVSVTMDADKTVTATFNTIQKSVLIYGKIGYDTLGMALLTYGASDSIMIKSSYDPLAENVLFDQPYSVSLTGGYDSNWALLPSDSSFIKGMLKIKAGKVTAKGIKIRP